MSLNESASRTLVEELADFTAAASYDVLPSSVVEEVRRLVIDSLGCGLAGQRSHRGRIAVEVGATLGGPEEATILGQGRRSSVLGAAFANGESINAMDFDPVLPPGHVVPFVLPGALALAERHHHDGRELIVALAVAHEMSHRLGKAMDYVRDVGDDGRMTHPSVFGYSSTVLAAAAVDARLLGQSSRAIAESIGIAASTTPVNAMWSSIQRAHAASTNYTVIGTAVVSAMLAARLAAAGHTGDHEILDDREFGFPRMIGTARWEPGALTDGLGSKWGFPREQAYKIYPHCRVPAALMDAMVELVAIHAIAPEEIEAIDAWGEPQGIKPVWANADVHTPTDALNSTPYGLSVSAHRVFPVSRWQDDEVIFHPSVQRLTGLVRVHVHPEYTVGGVTDPAARPSKLEVRARGTVFSAERSFPRGAITRDPTTQISWDELVDKFRENAAPTIGASRADRLIQRVLELEDVEDVADLMSETRPE